MSWFQLKRPPIRRQLFIYRSVKIRVLLRSKAIGLRVGVNGSSE